MNTKTILTTRKRTLLGYEFNAPHRPVFLLEDRDTRTGRPRRAYGIQTYSGTLLLVKTTKIIPLKNNNIKR